MNEDHLYSLSHWNKFWSISFMNIVQIIDQHTFALKHAIEQASLMQRKSLVKAVFGFYEKLPHFYQTIEQYYHIHIENNQLLKDIDQENLALYQNQIKLANAEVDEYSDDYEELEAIQIIALDAFSMVVSNQNKSKNLLALLSSVIEVLDYYENFSDDPAYWNQVLEQEIIFQKQIMNEISENVIVDESIYVQRYQSIEFADLD